MPGVKPELKLRLESYALFQRFSHPDVPFVIDREVPRCVAACPAGCDARGYVTLIAKRKFEEAYSLIKERIPFPAVLGRVCHHPCEQNCKRGFFDEPVAIAALKRFVAEYYEKTQKHERGEARKVRKKSGKRVAVIGAGPAGLTAAIDLATAGHSVTVFEASSKIGRVLRLIPRCILPRDVLDADLERALDGLDIEIRTGCRVGKDVRFEDLRRAYDAVLIAVGLQSGRLLDVRGRDLKGVYSAISLLEKVSLGESVHFGDAVVVIGGGNTAVDAARVLLRLGVRDVHVVCVEAREEMPAFEWEVKEMLSEGVKLHNSWGVKEIIGEGKVEKVRFVRCVSAFDERGNFAPKFDESVTMELKADAVVFAVGQAADLSFLEGSGVEFEGGMIKVDPLTLATSQDGVFAAGDIVRGAATIIEAIADGHRAAESIDRYLRGVDLRAERSLRRLPEEHDEIKAKIAAELAKEMRLMGVEPVERLRMKKGEKLSFEDIYASIGEEEAVKEAMRCLSCRSCKLTPVRIKSKELAPDFLTELVRSTKINMCVECGKCTAVCPVAAVNPEFAPRLLAMRALFGGESLLEGLEIWRCDLCGACNAFCPYGVDFVGFILGLRRMSLSMAAAMPKFSEGGWLSEVEVGGGRLDWVGDGIKVAERGDVYYFSGCLSFFEKVYSDRKLKLGEIARAAVKLLNAVGVVPAVSSEERCCGHDLLWAGDVASFEELAKHNIEVIKGSGAKVVVFTCAECLRTFELDYRRAFKGDLDLTFMHISEFLRDKNVPLQQGGDKEVVTFHDPCGLRQLGIFDAPRDMIMRTGVKLVEMEHSRELATCCGVSGFLTCGPEAKLMQEERLREAERAGASKLIVACPKCLIHLDCATSASPTSEIKIEDLTVLLASRL